MINSQKSMLILFALCSLMILISCDSDSKKKSDRYRANKDKIYTGDYYIRNKADLDALKGYISVSGTLYIESDLDSLEGLESLESIGADLNISGNDSLVNLNGLNNIDTIKLELIIKENPVLSNLDGINSLKFVAGIGLYSNERLKNIKALSEITVVEGSIWLEGNLSLGTIEGFENLTIVNGSLILKNNGLTTVKALNNIKSIGGDLVIYANNSLGSLETEVFKPPIREPFYEGLNSLSSVGKYLEISGNEILQNLNGLNNLSSVGHLIINNNGLLNNLGAIKYKSLDPFTYEEVKKGLVSLTSVNGDVLIMDNYSLPNLEGLNNLTSIGRNLGIYDNINLANLEKKTLNPIIDDFELVGLNKISSVKGDVQIWGNDSLRSLKGLMRLTSLTGTLNIGSNTMLTNLEGLDNITSVEDLIIEWNDNLLDLEPLDNILNVSGNLSIQYNPLITNLQGLHNIPAVHHLYIIGNDELIDLGGLIGIDSVSGDIEITYNKSLTGLGISICNLPGNLTITHNPLLTNEKAFEWEKIINDCGSISGEVLIEKNDDTAFDYNYEEEEEGESDESLPSDGPKVEVKEFSLTNINENEFSIMWDISYNNPDYTYYQMHLYLIDKNTIGPEDWSDGQFISGEKVLSNYSMGENISGTCDFAYDSTANKLYYENEAGEQSISLDTSVTNYYFLCVGQTQIMNLDLTWSYYESHTISESLF